jgi:HAD superfamily hydrolase (TIGR01509 family)
MKALLFDFSRTLLFPQDPTDQRTLNQLHQALSRNKDYQIFDHFRLNQELLEFLHSVKDELDLYIFTSGTMISSVPELQSHLTDFKKIYSGTELGLDKSVPASYTFVARDIDLPPEEILFIDDSPTNITAAKESGLEVLHYKDNEAVMNGISGRIY